jgi:hypothetical protein
MKVVIADGRRIVGITNRTRGTFKNDTGNTNNSFTLLLPLTTDDEDEVDDDDDGVDGVVDALPPLPFPCLADILNGHHTAIQKTVSDSVTPDEHMVIAVSNDD